MRKLESASLKSQAVFYWAPIPSTQHRTQPVTVLDQGLLNE